LLQHPPVPADICSLPSGARGCHAPVSRCRINAGMIAMTWSDTFLGILKDNDVRLISYVPDNVLTPLIKCTMKGLGTGRGGALEA
jgi:hypothetical protein